MDESDTLFSGNLRFDDSIANQLNAQGRCNYKLVDLLNADLQLGIGSSQVAVSEVQAGWGPDGIGEA